MRGIWRYSAAMTREDGKGHAVLIAKVLGAARNCCASAGGWYIDIFSTLHA